MLELLQKPWNYLLFPATCGVIILIAAGAQSVAKQSTCVVPPPPHSSHTPQSAGNRRGELVTHGYRDWPSDVHNHGSLGSVMHTLWTIYLVGANKQYALLQRLQVYTTCVYF